ncbi:hypothetical protein GGR51DRAFT_566603 [Nemania sp. FL0031]|nr:hypothetical protein GGR51DRAFT_566603 [Nemania sp. FL0031]
MRNSTIYLAIASAMLSRSLNSEARIQTFLPQAEVAPVAAGEHEFLTQDHEDIWTTITVATWTPAAPWPHTGTPGPLTITIEASFSPTTTLAVPNVPATTTTEVPPPKITLGTPTSTMTTVPPGFGVETLPGQTYWGWVTTTRADGTSTVLPVVAGNMVWELPAIPHIDFDFPQFNLPGFSLPCIRILFIEIGNCDDPPTPDDSPSNGSLPPSPPPPPPPPPDSPPKPTQSEPQQETTSSCTAIRTVSNCEVTCSMSVANPSTTVTTCYNTVCSTTTISCSSTGTTATSVITSGCPMSILPPSLYQMPVIVWDSSLAECVIECPAFNEWEADLDDPDEWTEPLNDNSFSWLDFISPSSHKGAEDPVYSGINVPNGKPVSVVGLSASSCWITDSSQVPGTPKVVVTPPYMRGPSVLSYDLAGSVTALDAMPRWLKITSNFFCEPSLTWVDASIIQSDTISVSMTHTGPGSVNQGAWPTIDHAFENQWLHWFFSRIINTTAQSIVDTTGPVEMINCDDLVYFMYGGVSGNRVRNYFKLVFDSLASWEHLEDMIGMTRSANSYAKSFVLSTPRLQRDLNRVLGPGYVTYPGDPWEGDILGPDPGFKNKIEEKLRYWHDIFLGMEIANDPILQGAIRRTNLRLLETFVQIDNELACEQAYQTGKWAFAPKYEDFIKNYTWFLTEPNILYGKVQALVASVHYDILLAIDAARAGVFSNDQVEELNGFIKQWNALVDVADPVDPDSPFLWKMDWGWPASTLLEKKPGIICNKPPYGSNSFTSEELTATAIATYNPASPASSVTIPYFQSTLSFAPDLSSTPISRITPAPSFLDSSTGLSATQTYIYCAKDFQCTEACEIGYSNQCELHGLGNHGYGICTCVSNSVVSSTSLSTSSILSTTPQPPPSQPPPSQPPPSQPPPSQPPPSQPPPSQPPPSQPPPPPTANCYFKDALIGVTFKVLDINGWAGDKGETLLREERGCGALTDWHWVDLNTGGQAIFLLPFFFKDGCVEDAIETAGGPRIQCHYKGIGDWSR